MNSILSALAENLTGSAAPIWDEPQTIAELLAALRALPEGRWTYPQAREAVERLLADSRRSASFTRELVVLRPELCAEYRGLLARLTGGYQRGVAALERLEAELAENELSEESLAGLEQAQEAARLAYGALSEPLLRCPRCAASGEFCQACGLEGLYPDLGPLPEVDPDLLTPGLLALYESTLAVESGLSSAGALADPLDALDDELLTGMTRALAVPDSDRKAALLEHARGMQEALDTLRRLFETRRSSALRAGWQQLYEHHCAILELL